MVSTTMLLSKVIRILVGALCKRPWHWKCLDVYCGSYGCIYVVLRAAPCTPCTPCTQCKERYLLTNLSFWHVATLNPCRLQPSTHTPLMHLHVHKRLGRSPSGHC